LSLFGLVAGENFFVVFSKVATHYFYPPSPILNAPGTIVQLYNNY